MTAAKRWSLPSPTAMRAAGRSMLLAQGVQTLAGVVFPKVAPETERDRMIWHVGNWLLQEADDIEAAEVPIPVVLVVKPGEPR